MKDHFCLDCEKLLAQVTLGVIEGWLRTDGDKEIVKVVPGGIVYGKELGFVCNECHNKAFKEVI